MTVSMPPRLREGIQVVDRSWMPGEPGATCLLASMDAEVMRIAPMDPRRVALARHVPPCLQASLALLQTPTACPAQWINASTVAATMSTILLRSTASVCT